MQASDRRNFNTKLAFGSALLGCATASQASIAASIKTKQADAFVDSMSVCTHFDRSDYQADCTAGVNSSRSWPALGFVTSEMALFRAKDPGSESSSLAIWLAKQI